MQDSDSQQLTSWRELQLPAELRTYQWAGVRFLLERNSALLADQMGLGKTVQVAVALSLLFASGIVSRALIVVPASLRLNWERELTRWAPTLSVRRVQGTTEDRIAYYRLPIHILVASYEQIRSDAIALGNEVQFGAIVLDEAQRIKNSDSDTALACRLLRRDRSWALTGTPIENSVTDLLSIFQFIRPGHLNVAMNRIETLGAMQSFYLRRKKMEVLTELPPIIVQDIILELSGRQREAYNNVWLNRHSSLQTRTVSFGASLFALITKLKQICNYDPESDESVKLEALHLIVDDLVSQDDKLIVFSQYVVSLNWLHANLSERLPCEVFHGGISESSRDEMITRFRQESGPRALLMSLKAAGVGLNLQEATTVVLFDRWWNPAVEDQAIHRAHRFGRMNPLQVFRFLVQDSIEERIQEVLDEKEHLFNEYIEEAEGAPVSAFSRNELMRIVQLNYIPSSSELLPG